MALTEARQELAQNPDNPSLITQVNQLESDYRILEQDIDDTRSRYRREETEREYRRGESDKRMEMRIKAEATGRRYERDTRRDTQRYTNMIRNGTAKWDGKILREYNNNEYGDAICRVCSSRERR